MYSNKRKNSSSNGEPVFVDDGIRCVCVGHIRNGVFIKQVKDKHILQKPLAIAIQTNVLELLISKGCHTVIALLTDQGKRLRASIDDFLKSGWKINRKFGYQIALPLSKWVDLNELNQQGSLFGGENDN